MAKADTAFRTIGEVAAALDVPQHVLRFWETRFPQIAPRKSGGGRRYYRPDDVALLAAIRKLLYVDRYTIKGVQRVLRSEGVEALRSGASAGISALEASRPDEQPHDFARSQILPQPADVAAGSDPVQARLLVLADTLDQCARTLADARARALTPT